MHSAYGLYAGRMSVDLRQLRALVAVIDQGTFTDAAIELQTSQASVSRAVADLERSVSSRLLQRTSQGAVPTVAGRRAAEHARRVLAEIALVERLGQSAAADLRVGFSWAIFGRLTVPLQHRWHADHPDGSLTFIQSRTPTAGLVEGDVDLAIIRRALDDDRFETSLVGTEARVVAVSADDPLARRRRLDLVDLVDRPIASDRATGSTTTALWPESARPTVLRDVHGMEEWLTLIAAGEAVGLTSEATADQFPRPEVRYRPVRDAPPIPVWLAWWRDDPPAGVAAFRQLVCELYAGR